LQAGTFSQKNNIVNRKEDWVCSESAFCFSFCTFSAFLTYLE
jgi:hypothetical protein